MPLGRTAACARAFPHVANRITGNSIKKTTMQRKALFQTQLPVYLAGGLCVLVVVCC